MEKVELNGVNSSYNLQTKNSKTVQSPIEKKDNSQKLKSTLTCLAAVGIALTASVTFYKFRGKILSKYSRKLPQTPAKVDKTMQQASNQSPALPELQNRQRGIATQVFTQNTAQNTVKVSVPTEINSSSEKAASQIEIKNVIKTPILKKGDSSDVKSAMPDVQASEKTLKIKPQPQSDIKAPKTSEQPEQEVVKKAQSQILQPKNPVAKEQDPVKIINSYSENNEEAFVKALSELDDATLQQANKLCPYSKFSQKDYIRYELEKRKCLKLYGIDITKPVQSPRQDAVKSHHGLNGFNISVRDRIKELKQNPSSENIHIDNLIKKTDEDFKNLSPLEADHTFYRGRVRNTIIEKFNEDLDLIDSSKAGDIITLDEAYPYFANDICLARQFGKSSNGAQDNYMYEVLAPKGSKLSCNMEHGGEAVFPRASKFEVISKEIKEDGSTFVKLRYILPGSVNC